MAAIVTICETGDMSVWNPLGRMSTRRVPCSLSALHPLAVGISDNWAQHNGAHPSLAAQQSFPATGSQVLGLAEGSYNNGSQQSAAGM